MNGLKDKASEDKGELVVSLRKTLESLLGRLNQRLDQDEDGKSHDVAEVDDSIEAFLSFVGSKFSLWIFDDLMDSRVLQTELWVSFFYPAVNKYRTEVVGRYKDEVQENPVAASQATKRFDKICKHVGYFYKQFVTRVVETFGFTPQLHYVVSILHLNLSRSISTPTANQAMIPTIHLSVHDALCHLGDLSRYRTSNGAKTSYQDFTHALVYYTTAFKIQPSSGMPLNQLGNISYSTGDIFSGTYYFLRSVAVDEPFKDGSSNLRIILKKLLKIKDSFLAKLNIAGIGSNDDTVDDSTLDVINEELDDKAASGVRYSKENVADVKENLMRLLQLYSTYYMSHLPSMKRHDHSLSHSLQIELTDKFFELVKARLIPSKILVKLAITGITFVWLHEQVREVDKSAQSFDAYNSCLGLTLKLLDKLLSVVHYHAAQDEYGILDSFGSRLKAPVRTLLPVFRIYFDWINKQVKDMRFTEWHLGNTTYNPLCVKITQFLELLRKAKGFQFDVLTAVARSNWDHFDDVLRQQEELSVTETDDSGSWRGDKSVSSISHQDQRRLLYENDEETQCSGLLPIHGGLDDTPSGLATMSRVHKSSQENYRTQCILFTGVEISRLSVTFLKLDEFAVEDGGFSFVEIDGGEQVTQDRLFSLGSGEEGSMDAHEDAALHDLISRKFDSVAPVEESTGMIDEPELYDQISRKAIPQQLQMSSRHHSHNDGNASDLSNLLPSMPRGPSVTSSDYSNRAVELEKKQAQFIARPGSNAYSVNASASPEFLRKLRALEHTGKGNGGNTGTNNGGGGSRSKAPARGSKKRDDRKPDGNRSVSRSVGGHSRTPPPKQQPPQHRQQQKQQQQRSSQPQPRQQQRQQVRYQQLQQSSTDESGSGSDNETSDESSDEEIVFLGRSRN